MKRVQQRFLATLLMVVMVLLLCPAAPVTVKADGAVWDTSIAEGFASGTGTKDDPFIIETAAQLAYLAQSTNSGTSYEGQYIKLVSDIALNDDTFTFDPDTGLIKVTDGNYVVYIGSGFKGDSSGPNTDFDTTARPWAYYMTQDPSEKGYNISGDPTKWNYCQ